jgi:hypothetical protein
MRSVVFAVIVVVGLLGAGVVGANQGPNAAPLANHSNATPPAEICSPVETANASLIEVVPASIREGVFSPHNPAGMGERMFLVSMTLPPNTCYTWHDLPGAVMLLVQEGTIDYTAQDAGISGAKIMKGDNDGFIEDSATPVALDAAITLHANEWITQDREVWFAFRNGGSDDAVVSLAYYGANPWDDDAGCLASCRKP